MRWWSEVTTRGHSPLFEAPEEGELDEALRFDGQGAPAVRTGKERILPTEC